MFFALIAAIFGGMGDVTNKVLLSRLKLKLNEYLPIVFIFLTVISFCFVPVNFKFEASQATQIGNIFLLALMIGSAAIWNTLLAKSMQSEPLHEYESIILMVPFVTVVLAMIFLPTERTLPTIIAGGIATLALLAIKYKKHHFAFTKSAPRTALAVIFIAIETVALRKLLNIYSPALLYFIRVLILSLVFNTIYKPNFKILAYRPVLFGLILAAIFGTGVMVLKYYAFAQVGVVITTLVLLLSQSITYLASYFYLKERRNFKPDLYCAGIVVACIIYSMLAK